MKRILIITTFLLVTFAASAQTLDAELVQCGIRICQNGQKLKYSDLKKLCDFANSIYPEYTECSSGNNCTVEHMGLFLVNKEDVDSYIDKYHPVQLRHNVRTPISNKGPAYNFGLAKGQTFDRVLIYPTDTIVQWFIKGAALSPETRSKLYVAVTRARYSVAFVYTPKSRNIGRFALFNEYADTYAENSLF